MICPASANSLTDNSPGSTTILFLWLLPPLGGEASYVVEMSQRVSEDQKPGFNFQTLPKRNILVHFLAFVLARESLGPDESYYRSVFLIKKSFTNLLITV